MESRDRGSFEHFHGSIRLCATGFQSLYGMHRQTYWRYTSQFNTGVRRSARAVVEQKVLRHEQRFSKMEALVDTWLERVLQDVGEYMPMKSEIHVSPHTYEWCARMCCLVFCLLIVMLLIYCYCFVFTEMRPCVYNILFI